MTGILGLFKGYGASKVKEIYDVSPVVDMLAGVPGVDQNVIELVRKYGSEYHIRVDGTSEDGKILIGERGEPSCCNPHGSPICIDVSKLPEHLKYIDEFEKIPLQKERR